MQKNNDYGVTRFKNEHALMDQWIGRIIKQTHHTFTVATEESILEQVKQKRSKKDKKKQSTKQEYVVGDFVSLVQLVGDERERTKEVRVDGKGKHTTTYSTLIPIPETESYVIDTTGIKSIATTKKVDKSSLFQDIEDLARFCKFRDCKHDTEPKCAVKEAVNNGELDKQRLERFHKVNS